MIRAALLWGLLASGNLAAETPAERATQAADALLDAGQMLRDATVAQDKVAALSTTVRAFEDGLSAMRESLRAVSRQAGGLRAEMDRDRATIGQFLSTLTAMGRAKDAQSTLHPQGALGTLRAGLVLSDLSPAVEARAEALRTRIDALETLNRVQQGAIAALRRGLADTEIARSALVRAAAAKETPASAADLATLQAILEAADTLAGFAEGLGSDGATGDGFAAARGTHPPPAAGRIRVPYQGVDQNGTKRSGVLLATYPRASVSTPALASVRYAGPFLNLGQIVILEPEAGYLIVLGGLQETFVNTGEVLDKGALVGMMGGNSPAADEILIEIADEGGHDRTETLYIEVRNNEETLDPEEWFGFEKD